jgi:hypothetical protein
MTKRPLLLPLLTSLLLLIALNLLIGAWSHRLPYYRTLEAIRAAQNPNLVFIGNSLLVNRIDEAALVQAAPGANFRPLNSALSASKPPEHLLLFNYALRIHPSIRTVVVGIFDFQLTVPDRTQIADLTGNRIMATDSRFPLSEVASAYGFSPVGRMEFEAMRALPLVANRANAWKFVELLRRSMDSMGMPHTATNSMGRVNDFADLEPYSVEGFETEAASFLQHPDRFNSSYESILSQASKAGVDVIVLVMPISPHHRNRFYARPIWSQYLQAVNCLAGRRGIRVIDASTWVPDQGFEDNLHMTTEAAHLFSIRLGSELAALR